MKVAHMKKAQTTVKTTINGNFPGYEKPARRPTALVDPSTLAICDDPMPSGRQVTTERKYDALFAALKPGQCIKCEPESVLPISNALRKYIGIYKLKDHIVRTALNYERTGTGRVWLLYVGRAS